MFSQRLTQSILNSKSRQLPPPQTKTQTQATVLKCSSQQQRTYMDKWDSKTWYNLQLRLRWNEKNLFSLKPLILERLKKPRDLSAEESQIIKNNFFQRVNITFVVQVARRQEPLLDTPVFLEIIISFTVQHFKKPICGRPNSSSKPVLCKRLMQDWHKKLAHILKNRI